jgi:hypothetical protein
MSWNDLPTEVQQTAARVLTSKQLDAWKLELAGVSIGRMSLMLDITRPVAREHLRAAHRWLSKAGIQHDHNGWRIEDAA